VKQLEQQPNLDKVRLDKFLWACRFYKTRAMAKQAIEGGKVHVNGDKPKVGRLIQVGDWLRVRVGYVERTVQVLAPSDKRGPAKVAQTLYQESEESIRKREELASMRRLAAPQNSGRPDKKQRRQIHRFRNIHDYSPDREPD